MTAQLVGIGGKLESGKDAVADYLVAEHGWRKLGMSDALNEAAMILNPWIKLSFDVAGFGSKGSFRKYRDIYNHVGYVQAKEHEEYREFLLMLGTEVGRDMIDPDVWVNIVRRRAQAILDQDINVILTGVRYPNEMELIGDMGGHLWYTDRPGWIPAKSQAAGHTSETSADYSKFDLKILNDGELKDLYKRVDDVLSSGKDAYRLQKA